MITGGEATLKDMLTAQGLDPDAPHLRWMVMTWDLAKIGDGSNKFYRFLMTQDALLTTYGKRNPGAFAFRNSKPMQIGNLTSTTGDPIAKAVKTTSQKLREGYVLVCRPLAVNCSVFAGAAMTDGSSVTKPRDLLGEIARKSKLGIGILDTVNQSRSDAERTHMNRELAWMGLAGVPPDDVWAGR